MRQPFHVYRSPLLNLFAFLFFFFFLFKSGSGQIATHPLGSGSTISCVVSCSTFLKSYRFYEPTGNPTASLLEHTSVDCQFPLHLSLHGIQQPYLCRLLVSVHPSNYVTSKFILVFGCVVKKANATMSELKVNVQKCYLYKIHVTLIYILSACPPQNKLSKSD